MDIENFCRALPNQRSIWLKADKQNSFWNNEYKGKGL